MKVNKFLEESYTKAINILEIVFKSKGLMGIFIIHLEGATVHFNYYYHPTTNIQKYQSIKSLISLLKTIDITIAINKIRHRIIINFDDLIILSYYNNKRIKTRDSILNFWIIYLNLVESKVLEMKLKEV